MRLVPAVRWTIVMRKDGWRNRLAAWLLNAAIAVCAKVCGNCVITETRLAS